MKSHFWRWVIILRNWLRQVHVVGISSVFFFQVSRCFKSIGLGRTRMQYARRCSGSQGKTTTTKWWLKTVKRGKLDVFLFFLLFGKLLYVIRFVFCFVTNISDGFILRTVVLMIWTFAVLMEPILMRLQQYGNLEWLLLDTANNSNRRGTHQTVWKREGSSSLIVPNGGGYVIFHSRAAGRANYQVKFGSILLQLLMHIQ